MNLYLVSAKSWPIMYLAPQPLGAVQEGGDAPSDLGLDWMLAAPSVCVTKGAVTELVGSFTLHCRRPRGPLKGVWHTTQCCLCHSGIGIIVPGRPSG